MKDAVIGCITNYNFNQIKYWVNSLDRCGFDGYKIMICYNIDYQTVEELTKRGYTIFGFKRDDANERLFYKDNFSIVVERFIHLWHFLNSFSEKENIRYVIMTDVKDVIFQRNPSEWLEKNLTTDKFGNKKTINLGSESIQYANEPWGRNNMQKAFGTQIYDMMKNKTIVNAGTTAGEFNDYLDLCLNIFLICNGMPGYVEGGGGPDQAALNILANTTAFRDKINVSRSECGWAAQLGTTKNHSFDVLEPRPTMNENNEIVTSKGIPFTLVHQWDRIPVWKEKVMEKYG